MISHLFYHNEAVEEKCAHNSWLSIKDIFEKEDEVIILDLGNTLKKTLEFDNQPKYVRIEKIITEKPKERSYTYGLNYIMPITRYDWIILWRSDYIYHKKYLSAVKKEIIKGDSNIILPYECFIGSYYANWKWSKKRLKLLTNGKEEDILKHSIVCPVYEYQDQAHFAIKKELWMESGGMNEMLYGYGYQFPELLSRLNKIKSYKASIKMDMISFHQVHEGSFSVGQMCNKKSEEIKQSRSNIIKLFGSEKQANAFVESIKQKPIIQRRPKNQYKVKINKNNQIINILKKSMKYLFNKYRKKL